MEVGECLGYHGKSLGSYGRTNLEERLPIDILFRIKNTDKFYFLKKRDKMPRAPETKIKMGEGTKIK